eukprot:s1247_g30.t1
METCLKIQHQTESSQMQKFHVLPSPAEQQQQNKQCMGQESLRLEKKPTVASLAGSLQQLIQANAGLSQQVQTLALGQQQLEKRALVPSSSPLPPQKLLSQPISSALPLQTLQSPAVAKAIGVPPRTAAPSNPGLLRSPWIQPAEITELEEEKQISGQSSSHEHLAQAVLAQSKALTALVSQIASQSSDPMLELGSTAFGAGTRGSQGRPKLQVELAAQKGTFFNAVLAAMARRMQPTASADGSLEELMSRGVMTILDFLQVGNLQAARDSAALMAVCLDQAALDNGRFDLALLLALQEDPPSTVFSHKPPSPLSKARAFTPLASQQWVTVALAYVKELDLISAKRLEMTTAPKANPFVASTGPSETAKPKPNAKKKPKGAGKGSNQTQAEEEG